jgi:CRISPR-associated exonuclease Cas4
VVSFSSVYWYRFGSGLKRRRTTVRFNDDLRNLVAQFALEMHRLLKQGQTPPPLFKPHCKSCSLMDICLPQTTFGGNKAGNYLKRNLL